MDQIIKKLIVIIVILIIIIIACILALKIWFQEKEEEKNITIEESFQEVNQLQKIDQENEWLNVQNCLNKYSNYSNNLQVIQKLREEGVTFTEQEETYNKNVEQRLGNIIPEFVKKELDITQENIYEKIATKDEVVRINNIYKSVQKVSSIPFEETTSIFAYIVEGVFIKKEDSSKREFKMVVIIDNVNNTFAILPNEYIEDKNIDVFKDKEIQLYQEEQIEKNKDNILSISSNINEEICQKYFANYKSDLIYDDEFAFNCLDKEYREKRFQNLDNFKYYIQQNWQEINKAELKKYQVNYYEDYKEYVCLDQYGNFYIFNQKEILEFTLKLDNYTIPTEKFIKTYQTKDEQKKVMMNVDKWIQMLNNRDYTAAYQVIDETYRNRTFGSQEEFEKVMKEKLPLHYEVKYTGFTNENGTYIQQISLMGIEKQNDNTINISIIMQLKEDLDFVMSFQFEEEE